MKKLLTVVAAALLSVASVFAGDMELSGKLNLGYATGASYFDTDYGSGYGDCSGFELYPALVIAPEATSFPDKPFDLTFEAALDMVFGKSDFYDGYKSTVITPDVAVLFNWHFENSDSEFLQKLVPYAGVHLGVSIQKTTFSMPYTEITYTTRYGEKVPSGSKTTTKDYSSTKVGLSLGEIAGVRYAVNDKIEVNAEFGNTFVSFHDFFFRLGGIYHFQRKGAVATTNASKDNSSKATSSSNASSSKPVKEKIEAGSTDDPFKSTSWNGDLGTIKFEEGGKCKFMGKDGTYKVTKKGETYTVSANCSGATFSLSTEGKKAKEGTFKTGTVKYTYTRQ